MASFNRVILAGNLTRDPELRYTPKGTAVAKLGIAVNRQWKTDTGEQKEEVTFIDVDAFGRTAEVIGQYLKKGRPILIEGRLKYDTWDDKQTSQKRSKLSVVLESFQFLDSGRGEPGAAGGPTGKRPAATAATAEPAGPAEAEAPPVDDDVPF
jgi:single-strand DNA-binding protein